MSKLLKKIYCFLCLFLLIDANILAYGESLNGKVITDLSPDQGLFSRKKKKRNKENLDRQRECQENKTEEHKPLKISEKLKTSSFVLVCDNSLESYDYMLEILKKANWSIEMSLCMTGGSLFQKIISTTKQRMLEQPELKVFFMLEPIFLDKQDRQVIHDLQEEFSERFFVTWTDFTPTNFPVANVHQRHSKFIVVDQRYFVLGGTNFEDLMCSRGDCIPEDIESPRRHMFTERPLAFRDQDVICCAEKIAKELRKEFHCSFKLWEYFSLTRIFIKDPNHFKNDNYFFEKDIEDSCIVDIFHSHSDLVSVSNDSLELYFSGPQYEEEHSPITNKYIDLINKAQKEVLIANLYFVPYKDLLDALVNRVQEGVNLEIIGNGANDKSPSIVEVYCWGNRYNYTSLLFGRTFYIWEQKFARSLPCNENVNIYEFYVDNTQLHKKIMIIDENQFVIGSYNFCLKSHNIDQEVILVITSPEVSKKAKVIFEKDKALSQKLSAQEILDWHFNLYYHAQGFIQTKYMPA